MMRNIIFDMDGTLADTSVMTMAALKKIAPRVGLPVPPVETVRAAIGYQNPEFYYRIYPDEATESVKIIAELTEDEEQRILPEMDEELLFPGIRELIAELIKNKFTLYVASTGSLRHVRSVLGKTGVINSFASLHCDKPEKIGMVAEIIGDGNKDDFIMVGDMKKDLEAAHSNGIMAVGACYGYCKRGTGFDWYIDKPMELLDIVK